MLDTPDGEIPGKTTVRAGNQASKIAETRNAHKGYLKLEDYDFFICLFS